MWLPDRSTIEAVELGLSAVVLLVAFVTASGLPRPYPTWPRVGPVPVDPELLVPGALALVVLVGVALDDPVGGTPDALHGSAIATGALAALTLWLAATSWYSLYSPGRGGVFFGGLFTLVAGTALAGAVVVRVAVRAVRERGRESGPGDPH